MVSSTIHRIRYKQKVLSQRAWQETHTTHHIQVDAQNGMQVMIVSSLAGGTGSGMLLDTAFLIRHMFQAQNPDLVGYLMLPPVFAPTIKDSEPIYANAYAALKELEFYSMRKDLRDGQAEQQLAASGRITSIHDFVVDWDNTGTPQRIAGPPFNTCYLINNQTMRGGQIGPLYKTNLCDMIAENIFMEFHAETFSARKRSVRSNLDDSLTGVLGYEYHDRQGTPLHREVFSCRFSTMGFSMIYVPVDRIRKACAYQLGLDLLNRWLAPHEVSGTLEEEMREHSLPNLRLRMGRTADDFRIALERQNDAGETFVQAIQASSDNLRRLLLDSVNTPQPNLREQIERYIRDYAKDMLDKPAEPAYWGAFVRRLELVNRPALLEQAQAAIRAELRNWLKNDRIRCSAAVSYLQTLNTILGKHYDTCLRARDRNRRIARDLRLEMRRYIEHSEVEEHRGWWVHRWSLRIYAEELCEIIRQHFEARVRILVYETAAQISQELQQFIGTQRVETHLDGTETTIREGLLQDLWRLTEDLGDIRTRMQTKLEAFEATSDHLIFTNLYQSGMYRKYYQRQRADGSRTVIDLPELENLYYAELSIDGPYDFKAQAEQRGLVNLQRALEDFCLKHFRHLDVDVDAVHTLYERYPHESNRMQVIEQFVRNGTAWLRPSHRAQVEQNIRANYDDDVQLGLHQPAGVVHANYTEIEGSILGLAQAAGFRSAVNTPVDVGRNAIYFYSELAGIPLVYIALVSGKLRW